MTRIGSEMAIIDLLAHQAERVCADQGPLFLNLVVASPGFVVLLYLSAWDAIDASEAADLVKADTKRVLQDRVAYLLRTALDVVTSDDPRLSVLQHGITVADEMGESPSDEVH
jgi:hypothetical protein